MIVKSVQVRRMPGMSFTGLDIQQDPNNPLGVIVKAGQITLTDGMQLVLGTDTPILLTPDPNKNMSAVISLTQSDGIVLNEWIVSPFSPYQAYTGGPFCDLAKFELPAGCTSLENVEVCIPVLMDNPERRGFIW